MSNVIKVLSVLALCATPVALFAQDSTNAADAPATEQTDTAGASGTTTDGVPAGANSLSLGEDVAEGPQIGATYIRETYGDWELRCVVTENGQDPCQLYQLLLDQAGTATAEVNLFGLGGGGRAVAGASIITPLETLLTEQLTMAIDSGSAKRYPFTWCSQIGCVARVGFTQEEVNNLKRGVIAKLMIVPVAAPDDQVQLTMSLSGFTAGFDAVNANNSALNQAPAE